MEVHMYRNLRNNSEKLKKRIRKNNNMYYLNSLVLLQTQKTFFETVLDNIMTSTNEIFMT